MRIDHIVLWVADPLRSVAWYAEVLGAEGVRVEEFRAKKVPFPSVRISGDTLIDLMPIAAAPALNAIPGAAGSAGNKVNHVCFAMTKDEYEQVRARAPAPVVMKHNFGAQGVAPESFYFADPDGNVLEARYY